MSCCSARSRCSSPTAWSPSTPARRLRSWPSSPPKGGHSPATSSPPCSGPRPTTTPRVAPCAGRSRRSARPWTTRASGSSAPRSPLERGGQRRSCRGRATGLVGDPPRPRGRRAHSSVVRSWPVSHCATARRSTTGRRPGRAAWNGSRRTCSSASRRLAGDDGDRRRGARRCPAPRGARSARRSRPAPADRAPGALRRPGRRDRAVSHAGRAVRPRARRAAAARDHRAVRGGPRGDARRPGPIAPRGRRADRAPPCQAVATRSRLPLVGRDDRARDRSSAPGAARTTDGRVALVEGEAGIGKTRLGEALASVVSAAAGRVWPAAATRARGRSPTVRSPSCCVPASACLAEPHDLPRSTSPSGRARPAASTCRRTSADRAATPARRGERARPLPRCPRQPRSRPSPRDRRPGCSGSTTSISPTTRLARPWPTWPVGFGRRLRAAPRGWRREDLSPQASVIADDLARIQGATVVSLGRLDRPAIADLVAAARPAGADADTAESLIDSLLAESEGLPLYVVEALAGGSPDEPGPPRSVQALLRDRIASVGETAGQVLAAASVIGRSFDLPTVRAASGRTEEETIDALEELIRRGIVREVVGRARGRRPLRLQPRPAARRRLRGDEPGPSAAAPSPDGRGPATRPGHGRPRPDRPLRPHRRARARGRTSRGGRRGLPRGRGDGPRRSTRTARRSSISMRHWRWATRTRPRPMPGSASCARAWASIPGRSPHSRRRLPLPVPPSCRRSRSRSVASTAGAATSRPRPATSSQRSPRRTSHDDLRARALAERSIVALRAGDLGIASATAAERPGRRGPGAATRTWPGSQNGWSAWSPVRVVISARLARRSSGASCWRPTTRTPRPRSPR